MYESMTIDGPKEAPGHPAKKEEEIGKRGTSWKLCDA
jgi:hypothetical protein